MPSEGLLENYQTEERKGPRANCRRGGKKLLGGNRRGGVEGKSPDLTNAHKDTIRLPPGEDINQRIAKSSAWKEGGSKGVKKGRGDRKFPIGTGRKEKKIERAQGPARLGGEGWDLRRR